MKAAKDEGWSQVAVKGKVKQSMFMKGTVVSPSKEAERDKDEQEQAKYNEKLYRGSAERTERCLSGK